MDKWKKNRYCFWAGVIFLSLIFCHAYIYITSFSNNSFFPLNLVILFLFIWVFLSPNEISVVRLFTLYFWILHVRQFGAFPPIQKSEFVCLWSLTPNVIYAVYVYLLKKYYLNSSAIWCTWLACWSQIPVPGYSPSELLKTNSLQLVLKSDYFSLWNGLIPAGSTATEFASGLATEMRFTCLESYVWKYYPFSKWETYG